MPGAGKTYYGKYAAQKLGIHFIDLDEEIVKKYQASISSIFQTKGESEFRKIELETIQEQISQCKEDTILSTGGGTPCYNGVMNLLNEKGITVWIDTPLKDLYLNIMDDNPQRPLLIGAKKAELVMKLDELYNRRKEFYEESRAKVSVYRGLSPDLFTKRLHLSTFAK